MKKLLLSLTTAATLAVSAQAGWITSAQSFNDPEVKSNKFSLDTYGLNPRLYEFSTSKLDCIIVYTENDLAEGKQGKMAPVMQCVKK